MTVVPGVTAPLESVIAALRVGVPWSGAMMLARQAGATDAAAAALLQALQPALVGPAAPPDAEPALPRVCVDGDGPTAGRIRALLADLGIRSVADADAGIDLAVIVGHFVIAPEQHGRWLRRDVPHLPLVFSDAEVRIGPLVEPGAGPCLTCLELGRVDDDPAWPAIASQLLHRTAPTETARLSIEAATITTGLVHDRVVGRSHEFSAASLAVDAETLSVRRRAHRPHERCGCRFLPENVIVLAGNAAGRRRPTSSGPGAGGRA